MPFQSSDSKWLISAKTTTTFKITDIAFQKANLVKSIKNNGFY